MTNATVIRTWIGGGYELKFDINFIDGASGGWTVMLGLNYRIRTINVSLCLIHLFIGTHNVMNRT